MENDFDIFESTLKGKWTPFLFKKFSEALKDGLSKGLSKKQIYTLFAKEYGVGEMSCISIFTELVNAKKAGYKSFDEYFSAGRPCRYGKQEMKSE